MGAEERKGEKGERVTGREGRERPSGFAPPPEKFPSYAIDGQFASGHTRPTCGGRIK